MDYDSDEFVGAPCTDPVYSPSLWEFRTHHYEPENEQRIRHNEALSLCYECPWTRRCSDLHNVVGGDGVWGGRLYDADKRNHMHFFEIRNISDAS